MAGLSLLPVTLIAAVVALLAATPVRLIETQRSRQDHTTMPASGADRWHASDRPPRLHRARALRHALRVFLRFSEQAARSAGVTPAQHELVLAVKGWPEDSAPSISDLADQLQLRNHSTVELVRQAEQAGL